MYDLAIDDGQQRADGVDLLRRHAEERFVEHRKICQLCLGKHAPLLLCKTDPGRVPRLELQGLLPRETLALRFLDGAAQRPAGHVIFDGLPDAEDADAC